MYKILCILLSILLSVAVQALEPSSRRGVSNDSFINYQWALENNGQKLYRDTDDIHPIVVESKIGYDVQWRELQKILKSFQNRKETVIAVIDSGVSDSHEDLKENLLSGKNFMSDDPRKQENTSDDIGHGTHVAGIIAAQINNSNGIAGVADKIKILPLKVYSAKKEREQKTFIERVAKAILFAVDQKVDVINLSLGWPLVIDLPVVQNAIQKALDQNITIVAGAGNDGHGLKVLPCSYKEVICVGAMGINGDIPNFSNYGGQVDMLAPGEAILSLWPAILMPKHFGLRKYNVVSGTSQATPYVSAAVAVLKSVFPGITNNEIRARLFASSKKDLLWTDKFALNGLLQIASSIKIQPQAVIRPIFKELDQVYVDPHSREFLISLPIKNYWNSSGPVQVQIVSLSSGIDLKNKNFSFKNLRSGEEVKLNIRGYAKDLSDNNNFRYKVFVKYGGRTEEYIHESTLALKTERLITPRVYRNLPNIQSIRHFENSNFKNLNSNNAEFYHESSSEEGLEITVYRFSENKLNPIRTILLPKAKGLYPHVGIVRVDLNYDGVNDYFISAIVKENKKLLIKHFAFNENLLPAYGVFSEWIFKDEGVLIHQPTLDFVKWNSDVFSSIAIPIFWSRGPIPEKDLNPDPFERKESVEKGLYYLTPVKVNNKIEMQTRLLNNEANVSYIRKKLNARFDEELNFLYFDIKDQSKVRVLISLGISSMLRYHIVEFDFNANTNSMFENIEIKNLNLSGLNLSYHSSKKISEDKIAFFGIYKNNLARLVILNTETFEFQDYELSSNSLENGIISLLDFQEDGDYINIFVEGVESFLLYKINKTTGSIKRFISPIHRFSYLPGQFFTDILFPVSVKEKMSIYIDSSNINSRNIHISTVGATNISTPIKWSLELPVNCTALTPKKLFAEDQEISYILLCKEGASYTLKAYQLN